MLPTGDGGGDSRGGKSADRGRSGRGRQLRPSEGPEAEVGAIPGRQEAGGAPLVSCFGQGLGSGGRCESPSGLRRWLAFYHHTREREGERVRETELRRKKNRRPTEAAYAAVEGEAGSGSAGIGDKLRADQFDGDLIRSIGRVGRI